MNSSDFEEVVVPPERPKIIYRADALHDVVTEAEDALITTGMPIFKRGQLLVVPISVEVIAADQRVTKSPSLKIVDIAILRDYLSRAAVFVKYDGRAKNFVPIPPPPDVAALLLSRAGEWRLRSIAGVITTPTMRPDGSILTEEGYDPTTKYYHIVDPHVDLRKLDIPDHPSRKEALACLGVLKELLSEFPFKSERDLSVALSAIISAVVRGALSLKPLHIFSAPEPGTGKSYLADVIAAFAVGNYCPVIAAAEGDHAETDKRLVALLIAGFPLVSLDNVTTVLGSAMLNQATERPLIEVRPLGSSEIMTIENDGMFLATGNNCRVRADMTRRTLRGELDAKMERPETRSFLSDPFREVLRNRDVYIAAVMTIVRAYRMSGARLNVEPFQSYREYTEFVREPLVWLGCEDPAKSTEEVRADDPDRIALHALCAAWHAAFGDEEVTVAAVIEAVAKKEGTAKKEATDEPTHIEDLRNALMTVAQSRGVIDANRLGVWLRNHKNKQTEGFHLTAGEMTRGSRRWKVTGPTGDERERSAPFTDREYKERREEMAEQRRLRMHLVPRDKGPR